MMEPAFEELLQRSLDGELSSEEQTRLQEYLAANPAHRAEAEDLAMVGRMLAGAQAVDPPEPWKQELLRRFRALAAAASAVPPPDASPTAAPRTSGGLRAALAGLRRYLTPATAAAFAAGAVAGIALLASIQPGGERPSRPGSDSLPGTMLPSSRLLTGAVLDERRLEWPEGALVVSMRAAGDGFVAEIEAQALGSSRIELQFDPAALAAVAFEQAETGTATALVEAGSVRIEHRGRNHYRLVLSRKGAGSSALRVRVQAGDSIRDAVVGTRRDGP